MRDHLNGGCSRPNDGDGLVAQLLEILAGVSVIESRRVEALAFEGTHPRDSRKLWLAERARPNPDEGGGEAVAAVGLNQPCADLLAPREPVCSRVEQRKAVQVVLPSDSLTLCIYLGPMRCFVCVCVCV